MGDTLATSEVILHDTYVNIHWPGLIAVIVVLVVCSAVVAWLFSRSRFRFSLRGLFVAGAAFAIVIVAARFTYRATHETKRERAAREMRELLEQLANPSIHSQSP